MILEILLSKYSFADASSVTEELFDFDNIHNLNFLETQVLDLAPDRPGLEKKVLFTSLPHCTLLNPKLPRMNQVL